MTTTLSSAEHLASYVEAARQVVTFYERAREVRTPAAFKGYPELLMKALDCYEPLLELMVLPPNSRSPHENVERFDAVRAGRGLTSTPVEEMEPHDVDVLIWAVTTSHEIDQLIAED